MSIEVFIEKIKNAEKMVEEAKADLAQHVGTFHGGEPEFDAENPDLSPFDQEYWGGVLWEADGTPEDPHPTFGDFAEGVQKHTGLDLNDLIAKWEGEGKPSMIAFDAHKSEFSYIEEIIKRALLAGLDVYDSDTRTYVFAATVRCSEDDEDCPKGCKNAAIEWLLKRMSA